VSIVLRQMGNFQLSWREQATFWWDYVRFCTRPTRRVGFL